MRLFATRFVGAVLAALTVSTGAMAQSYYDDQACRQFADAQIARCATRPIPRLSEVLFLALVLGQRSVRRLAVAAEPASERHQVRSSAPALALPMPRMRRVISSNNTMVTTHNAWRRGDIHHRNIADRRRLMRSRRAILQRQAMDRHQGIRAARPATT